MTNSNPSFLCTHTFFLLYCQPSIHTHTHTYIHTPQKPLSDSCCGILNQWLQRSQSFFCIVHSVLKCWLSNLQLSVTVILPCSQRTETG